MLYSDSLAGAHCSLPPAFTQQEGRDLQQKVLHFLFYPHLLLLLVGAAAGRRQEALLLLKPAPCESIGIPLLLLYSKNNEGGLQCRGQDCQRARKMVRRGCAVFLKTAFSLKLAGANFPETESMLC
ncbi:hypothetical protein DR999_PMT11305 [Platysternon megacephalum]|uniref:Uncharacterized protein n=1 Tax=Platysternon megacephalum TaxID=55544 RepID=A0A4D9EEN5_9SAUR|nr:hypothetical protein DR999_PMT11305 [Platysternon megacephalum]